MKSQQKTHSHDRRTQAGQRSTPDRKHSHALAAGAALVALVLVSYAPILQAGFIWDDDFYVTNNSTLHSLDGLRRIWFELGAVPQYYPLVHTTFWIEQHLWGIDPLGYHVVNVLLHALTVVLLWRLLVRLNLPGAWFAAALFAVHPVEVESVAWITERKNVLSLALGLGAMLCYLRFSPPDAAAKPDERRRPLRTGWYAGALALFTAALFSKTVVATLPAVLLVIFWWRRGQVTLRDVGELVPFFVVAVGLGLVTVWMEKHHVGASGAEWSSSPAERLLVAGRAAWFYAGKLAWPNLLAFFYPRWEIELRAAWQAMFPLAAAACIITLWLARSRIGRGPLAAVLIFLGVLTPALGFFDVYPFRYSFVADHFQYHASVALLALAGAGTALGAQRYFPEKAIVGQAIGGAVLFGLAVVTFCQTFVYYDLETLYEDTIRKNPQSWAAYTNLSLYYSTRGRLDEALTKAEAALLIAPERSDIHGNLAAVLLEEFNRAGGNPAKLTRALEEFAIAVKIDPANLQARQGYGFALVRAGRFSEAEQQFEAVLAALPADAVSLHGLGLVRANAGQFAEAERNLRAALESDPENLDMRQDLGVVLVRLGHDDEARTQFEAVLLRDPSRATSYFELAGVSRRSGDLKSAIDRYSTAVKLRPDAIDALYNLATTLLEAGQPEEGIERLREVLLRNPESREAREALERALKGVDRR